LATHGSGGDLDGSEEARGRSGGSLLGEATPEPPLSSVEESQLPEQGLLKGVESKAPPWGPEMFASAAYRRSRFGGAEWNDRVAEADDKVIAEPLLPISPLPSRPARSRAWEAGTN
jgi:hypothetical protein